MNDSHPEVLYEGDTLPDVVNAWRYLLPRTSKELFRATLLLALVVGPLSVAVYSVINSIANP